jgi:hypothetical protein
MSAALGTLYSPGLVSDLPFDLGPDLGDRLIRHLDIEGKIPRAFESLGPVSGRDVVLVDGSTRLRAHQLEALGARVTLHDPATVAVPAGVPASAPRFGDGLPDSSADAVIGLWTAFRGLNASEMVEADRILRPGGRLLILHDYGRDDISRLRSPDLPEYGTWSKRDGPFLRGGFKIRVIHCWWTFDSVEDAQAFLSEAFAERGTALAASLKRPRLSYNVAIYHRSREGAVAETA